MANALLAAGLIESSGRNSLTVYQGVGTTSGILFTSATAIIGLFTHFYNYCMAVINVPGNNAMSQDSGLQIIWDISGQCTAQYSSSATVYWTYIE